MVHSTKADLADTTSDSESFQEEEHVVLHIAEEDSLQGASKLPDWLFVSMWKKTLWEKSEQHESNIQYSVYE